MSRHRKEDLIRIAMRAFAAQGWTIELLSSEKAHPARFTLTRDEERHIVKLYIWNLSHGGRGRSADEYRIQATGIERFEPEPDGRTLVLGWDDGLGLFAGFDAADHLQELGSSPSMQITRSTLERALAEGGGIQAKRDGSFVVGIRPDRLDRYLLDFTDIHEGDTSALLVGEDADRFSMDEAFSALAEPGVTFDFHRPGANILAQTVRDRAEALLAELNVNPVARGQIGHNGPPEPIDDEADDLRRALAEIAKEAGKATPDSKTLTKAGGFLASISGALAKARAEAGHLLDKGKDLAREHVVTIVVGGLVGVAKHIPDLLDALLKVLLKWLQLAAGLF